MTAGGKPEVPDRFGLASRLLFAHQQNLMIHENLRGPIPPNAAFSPVK